MRWSDPDCLHDYWAWGKKYYDSDPTDGLATYGYQVAQAMEYILRRCGEDLTRENVMRVATGMQDVKFPLLVPGVTVNTSPADYHPIDQFELLRFNGDSWDAISEVTRP